MYHMCITCVIYVVVLVYYTHTAVIHMTHKWSYITGVAQLAIHVLQVRHNWSCITGVTQLTMYYRCGTTGHVLQVRHNWPCITGVTQLAMYDR